MIRVTVWNEFKGSGEQPEALKVYPNGIHGAIAGILSKEKDMTVKCAVLTDPEHGLSDDVLSNTDVLLWWGHCHHGDVADEVVERVVRHVNAGMGAIFLHSAHMSKPFRRLMGTSCTLKWREDGERERLWTVSPAHPIAYNVPETFVIPHEEMYGERFDVPQPEEIVFLGWFPGGEVMRSGICYSRGLGRVFYFQPGHETFPVYVQPEIQRILINAVRWCNPAVRADELCCPNYPRSEN